MQEPILTKEGQGILDIILNIRPPAIQKKRREEYLRFISFLMNEQGVKEAGRDLIIEAIKMVESCGFAPVLHRMVDPDQFQKLSVEPNNDMEAYYALPRQIRRWDCPPIQPTRPPHETKVLAFCASPRKGGNGDTLIDEAIRGAQDTGAKVEKFMLQKMKIKSCLGCKECRQEGFEGFCRVKDAMTDIYTKIIDSHAIIFGFPIYTGRECGQLSIFLDRWYPLGAYRLKGSRRAMVIGTWGYHSMDTYDDVIERIILSLLSFNIVTVEAISACGFAGMLNGLDDKGKAMILRFPRELEKAYQAGKSLVTGQR
jgi:multimeric flavodoxin WrbA